MVLYICKIKERKILNTRKGKTMMYNEFVNGKGCKENDHNYKVYENLEILYMNSDMSKEEIYEYGKKLVDNSKSEAEIEAENKIKEEIAYYKERLEFAKKWRNEYKENYEFWKAENDKELAKSNYNIFKQYRDECTQLRGIIKGFSFFC